MPPTAYCPWCGAELTISCYDIRRLQITWNRCKATYPCQGGIYDIITDQQGFIIFPLQKRNKYLYARDPKAKPPFLHPARKLV